MHRRPSVLRFPFLGALVVMLVAVVGLACSTPAPQPRSLTYAEPVFEADEVEVIEGVVYGQGRTDDGDTTDLPLDVFRPPPDGAARPTLVLVHAGSFTFGDRTMMHEPARAWARRGFVAVVIGYRQSPDQTFEAVLNAAADGQVALRWLRANADRYDIDPDRIAVLGSSAGGAIALSTALGVDLNGDEAATALRWPGEGPPAGFELGRGGPGFDHLPQAAVSTGAAPGPAWLDLLPAAATPEGPARPLLLHHHDSDSVTGESAEAARRICKYWEEAGQTCDLVISPGPGHVVDLGPDGPLSADTVLPFLLRHLDLP
jgi:acetyl esterase/lipase